MKKDKVFRRKKIIEIRRRSLTSFFSTAENQSRYKELENQRQLDNLKRQLQDALVSRRRVRGTYHPNSSNNSSDSQSPNNPHDASRQ